MNCKCYEKISQQLLDKETYEGREILDVQMNDILYVFSTESGGSTGTLSYQEFEVELSGLKKSKKVKISHTYCPYCGVKAGKINENDQEEKPSKELKYGTKI